MDWRAGIWFENRLQMNNYSIKLDLLTNSSDQDYHIVALERLKHFVYYELDSTVFVKQDQTTAIQNLLTAGINVTTTPEDPIDQIIGLVLFSKLNAIMEDHIIVKALDIASDLGDRIHYLHSDQEKTFVNFGTGWWDDATPWHGSNKKPRNKNIVKIQRTPTWEDFDLDWESADPKQVDNYENTVVKFHRDENEQTR